MNETPHEDHLRAIQPLLDKGWTPGELIWLVQEKLRKRAIDELGGTPEMLTDPLCAQLDKVLHDLRLLFPTAEATEPRKGTRG
jgi:hypothetical protein